ncbi:MULTISPECIES: hypothetical protein [unclassified Prochlorococcus]|nr:MULTISPECIES: hypothetical protein [unclassified Prochlorococcus]KGG26787.1 hypothetical protein EV12_1568 [Prochlorococcus sp. MIT 0701]KGG31468.1 hypothetical protein EV14_2260 [Prochlorococcus sp. MIT 0703]
MLTYPAGMSTGVSLGVIQRQTGFQVRVTEERARSGDQLLELVLDLLDSLDEFGTPELIFGSVLLKSNPIADSNTVGIVSR